MGNYLNPKYNSPEEIPEAEIARYSWIKGVRGNLDKSFGESTWKYKDDPQAENGPYVWSRKEVIDYILNTIPKGRMLREQIEKAQQTLSARKAKALKQFDKYTFNDENAIEQMIEIQMQIEILNERARNPAIDDESAQKLMLTAAKLSGESRQIAASLGINRAARDTQVDVADELKKFSEGALKLLLDRSIQITCPKCKRKINQGYILYHFKGNMPFRWWSLCPNPKCGADIIIQGEADPNQDWRELVGLNEEKHEPKTTRSPFDNARLRDPIGDLEVAEAGREE